MSLTDKIIIGSVGVGTALVGGIVVGGVMIIYSGLGAAMGAIGGEILDWIPYLNRAIPKGIAYVGNAFSDQDNTKQTIEYLQGNLDKVGAVAGFLGGFVRSTTSSREKKVREEKPIKKVVL
jgi:hypothetical protein